MDATLTLAALAGAIAGFAASAVPGLHVNALALLFLAAAPSAGAPGAAFLVAALAASPFGLALPATFLGGTSEESALAGMPAHALAREGRAEEAVSLQAWGAMLGVLMALPLAALAQPALVALAPRLADALPWLILLVVVLLVATEPARFAVHPRDVVVPHGSPGGRLVRGMLFREGRRWRIGGARVLDPDGLLAGETLGTRVEARLMRVRVRGPLSRTAGRAGALFALALSGALGLAALPLGASSPLGLPASPLLPLLAGLFAAPALVEAMRESRARGSGGRLRAPRHPLGPLARAAAPGAAVSALLGLVPGVSASHAALLAPRAGEPERALVQLAAVNGGAVVFTLLAWHALGKARAGALVAAQALAAPARWTERVLPAGALVDEAVLVVVAATMAALLARAASCPLAKAHARLAPRRLALGGLVVLAAMTLAFTGLLGLYELAAAALVGLAIARLRVRRSLAMGVILVPALLRAWGVA